MGVSSFIMVKTTSSTDFSELVFSRSTKDKIVALYKAIASGNVEYKTEGYLRACQPLLYFRCLNGFVPFPSRPGRVAGEDSNSALPFEPVLSNCYRICRR
jgi:hypothetical protein